jgi:hypothetical protein
MTNEQIYNPPFFRNPKPNFQESELFLQTQHQFQEEGKLLQGALLPLYQLTPPIRIVFDWPYIIDQGSPCPLVTLNPFGRELLLSDVFARSKRSTWI